MIPIMHDHHPFYIKWRQVKIEWGERGRDGEREREKRIKGERDGA